MRISDWSSDVCSSDLMQAFGQLIADGADFLAIDAAMERFGWPMGPAYLNDVIGMDTAIHVSQIIAAGFPEHMKTRWQDPLRFLVAHKRYGQRTAERRGGQEWVSRGRARGSRGIY